MRVLITCGPGHEPVDEVRRLTNFSTGELGVRLANHLVAAGHEVHCLKGAGATWPGPLTTPHQAVFSTNQDLLTQLERLAAGPAFAAVFHAAALSDFAVGRVEDGQGRPLAGRKIDSRAGEVVLRLVPAPKVISALRGLFPSARLVGWKYELDGDADAALAKGWTQIGAARTDACVVNGRAFGAGFAFCERPDRVTRLADKAALAEFLGRWLGT